MDISNRNINFGFKQNYFRLGFYANSLLLNKKMYLLYNFWNKKKELFFLKNKKKYIGKNLNFLLLSSFKSKYVSNKIYNFDYLNKWSSSFFQFSDLIYWNLNPMEDLNKKKFLIDTMNSLDYSIFDNVFFNFYWNNKKSFFYYNRNNIFLDFFFKLKKNLKMKFSYFYLFYIYDNLYVLNRNFLKIVCKFYWNNIYNYKFFNNIKNIIKQNYINIINKKLLFYFSYKKKIKQNYINIINKKLLSYFFFITKIIEKKNILVNNLYTNLKKKDYLFFKFFKFQLFYRIKFNRFFYKWNKIKMRALLEKKFLSSMSLNIKKNLKKKLFFSFLKKNKYNKNFFYVRNFYKLNNWVFDLDLKRKIKNKIIYKKKKKYSHRILKKLKKFRYNIDQGTLTKEQVYKRFKKSVFKKFSRKRTNRKKRISLGRRFNLYVYNTRKNYKNRMKAKALENKITPKYFFFKGKKNDYVNLKKLKEGITWSQIPVRFLIKKKEKKEIEEKKKEKSKNFKKFFFLKKKSLLKFKKNWLKLYKYRKTQYIKYGVFKYMSLLNKIYTINKSLSKKKRTKYYKNKVQKINFNFNVKKRKFWFFQKTIVFFKNIIINKKNKNFLYYNYIKHSHNNIKNFYFYFFLFIVKFLNLFFFYFGSKKKKKFLNFLHSIKILIRKYIIFSIFFTFYYKMKKFLVMEINKNKKKERIKLKKLKQILFVKKLYYFFQFVNSKEWMTWKQRKLWDKLTNFIIMRLDKSKKEFKFWVWWIIKINKKMDLSKYNYKVRMGYMPPNDEKNPNPNYKKKIYISK